MLHLVSCISQYYVVGNTLDCHSPVNRLYLNPNKIPLILGLQSPGSDRRLQKHWVTPLTLILAKKFLLWHCHFMKEFSVPIPFPSTKFLWTSVSKMPLPTRPTAGNSSPAALLALISSAFRTTTLSSASQKPTLFKATSFLIETLSNTSSFHTFKLAFRAFNLAAGI